MNKIFWRLNIFIKPVGLREPGGLSSLLVSKFFELCKELIATVNHYHLPYCRLPSTNWKHWLQHHLYVFWHWTAAFLMTVFTLGFPNFSFKACVANGRMCLADEHADSSAGGCLWQTWSGGHRQLPNPTGRESSRPVPLPRPSYRPEIHLLVCQQQKRCRTLPYPPSGLSSNLDPARRAKIRMDLGGRTRLRSHSAARGRTARCGAAALAGHAWHFE